MARESDIRKHETSFCADVKSWMEALFAQHPEWPFAQVFIEEYGHGSNKRQDIRILERNRSTPVLTGEVKMPGTPEGRSPYDSDLVRDAFDKAENIQSRFFFTWNVNRFVLFDRSQWDRPLLDRRVKDWDLDLQLISAGDCANPEVQESIREKFLPQFLAEFAEIVSGRKPDWAMPPDLVFIRSLESHLEWPVFGTRSYLAERCASDKLFAGRFARWLAEELQLTFDPNDVENWRRALDRASRTLCYTFCNRAIFYNAIRARYADSLCKLEIPPDKLDYDKKYNYFRGRFEQAVQATGDYEPVFYPDVDDWVGALIFAGDKASQGWKGFLANLDQYDFRQIPHDVIGGIFQKLIAPEERQKFGQYFTHEDIVDVINAFCIRRAGDAVLDPACGSGSFLVRAYHRKAWLSEQRSGGRRHQDMHKTHQELLQELFGCDIALFPAHLATLNLAARRIEDEDNYPLIRRGNFFEVIEKPEKFCTVPVRNPQGKKERRAVALPPLDAVVGNPPYVRQEMVPRKAAIRKGPDETTASYVSRLSATKEHLQKLVSNAWNGGLKLSGRSDLHCYFWPVAAKRLKEGGYFGFLTSSSWLDVEYGFAMQGWILRNFKLVAVIESVDEPWFEDARIKTCATIMQRCSDEKARNENVVRFVRLEKPLAEILGDPAPTDESARQRAANNLRGLIESTREPYSDDRLRIIPVQQGRLWQEGVEAGRILAGSGLDQSDREDENAPNGDGNVIAEAREAFVRSTGYAGGKWGRFIRAPEIYFRVMREYGSRLVKLGEIAEIRFGIKSGCDAFFMPRDVTEEILDEVRKGTIWNNVPLMNACKLAEVKSGKVRIVQAGDNTIHPIEAEYLRPELHSLMEVQRPIVRAADLNRVVLWVNRSLRELAGTYVAKYIRWGAKETFVSNRSKSVPVPQRSTCAARPRWYDLTGGEPGIAFWPMAQQYRHVIPANPEHLVCNHNLFYIDAASVTAHERAILPAMLNSTFLALFKTYYGRYAGTEGNLKTEVVDVNLLDVPDVRGVSDKVARRIAGAFARMQRRDTSALVEEEFMNCHSAEHVRELAKRAIALSAELRQKDRRELDDAVLEMIGVADEEERARLLDELYIETARHYRQIRIVEVQKQVQRAGANKRLSAEDVAGSIWDSLADDEKGPPMSLWLESLKGARMAVNIHDGKARAAGPGHMFTPAEVDFAQDKRVRHETYAHPAQAALVTLLANLDVRGQVELPVAEAACKQWAISVERRLADARARFEELTGSRTGDDTLHAGIVTLLMRWFVVGRDRRAASGFIQHP